MLLRLERALGLVFLVVGTGIVVSIIAFTLTASTPGYRYLGPLCADDVAAPGFDPWTGQVHGRIVNLYDCPPDPPEARENVRPHEYPVPEELVGRTVITIPTGFVAGCVAAIVVLGIARLRRRPDGGATVEPAAPVAA